MKKTVTITNNTKRGFWLQARKHTNGETFGVSPRVMIAADQSVEVPAWYFEAMRTEKGYARLFRRNRGGFSLSGADGITELAAPLAGDPAAAAELERMRLENEELRAFKRAAEDEKRAKADAKKSRGAKAEPDEKGDDKKPEQTAG